MSMKSFWISCVLVLALLIFFSLPTIYRSQEELEHLIEQEDHEPSFVYPLFSKMHSFFKEVRANFVHVR
jgi:hypothetical protein